MTRSCSPPLFRTLVLAVALVGHGAGCASQPIVEPHPVLAAGNPADTRAAILRSLLREEWILEADQPGEIVANKGGSKWQIVVAIRYGEQVALSYQSSRGLDYQDTQGDPRIHRGYNGRVQELMDEIAKEITLVRATRPLPAIAAPPAPAEAGPP